MEESISSSPSELELELPGFRFHPTEEELLGFYLKNMIFGKKLHFDIIGFLNIYLHEPWDLPGLAKIGEREWYFFVPREKKNGSGGRPKRTTETGFWKATGMDRKILSLSDPKKMIGLKKTLVFYKGRAPRGCKTDWIMNEYRLPTCPSSKDIVLCKIYRKATSKKVLEERAAMEEERKTAHSLEPSLTLPMETISFCSQCKEYSAAPMAAPHVAFKKELDVVITEEIGYEEADDQSRRSITTSLQLPPGNEKLPELEVPRFSTDWTQDSFWSPWLNNLTPYANLLNF